MKNSAVFMAHTFSATAVVTNRLMFMPALLISATAAFSDAGNRNGWVLIYFFVTRRSSRSAVV